MKIKIGIILHYTETDLDFSYVADQLGCEIYFKRGVMEYAIEVAQQLERDCRVDAIISSAATARVISPYVTVPTVPLYISNFNLIDAFIRAQRLGSSYAFVDITEDCIYDLDYISSMMGYDIMRYDFHAVSETEQVVRQIVEDQREVVVTAANCMYSCAVRNHLKAVLIRVTEQDIISTIDTAKKLLVIKNQETERAKWLSVIVENFSDGLITMNDEGKITLVNSVAQDMLRIPASELIGRSASLFAERSPILKAALDNSKELTVVQNHGNEYVLSLRPVTSAGKYYGSVIHVRILKELQETELFVRKKVLEHGFVAQNTFDNIVGQSERFSAVYKKAQRYAQTDSTVLILGESGCGKELFAQGTHNAGSRKNGPFVAINCATLSENLLDSELFGYEDGAFTGAKRGGKAGLFELAHGGTLFLDEIGELPIQLQAKLLRTLQEKSVRRLGGSKNIPIDVRVIFATNRNLLDEVSKGNFREDLYYRINILTLTIPPLRDRKEDIPLLAKNYLSRLSAGLQPPGGLTQAQCQMLMQYDWPGNVRELNNFLERLTAMLSEEQPFDAVFDTLFTELISAACSSQDGPNASENHLVVPVGNMKDIEQSVIQQMLSRCHGNKRDVETVLGISSTTLWRRMKEGK